MSNTNSELKEMLDAILALNVNQKIKEMESHLDSIVLTNQEEFKDMFLKYQRVLWTNKLVQRYIDNQQKQGFSKWPNGNFIIFNYLYSRVKASTEIYVSIVICLILFFLRAFIPQAFTSLFNVIIIGIFSCLLVNYGSKYFLIRKEMILTGLEFPGLKSVFKLKPLGYENLMYEEKKPQMQPDLIAKPNEPYEKKFFLSEDGKNILTREEYLQEQENKEKGE